MRTIEIIEGVTLTATEEALALFAEVRKCWETLHQPLCEDWDWSDWDWEWSLYDEALSSWYCYRGQYQKIFQKTIDKSERMC